MFEKQQYTCPHCNTVIRQPLSDGDELHCDVCSRVFAVLVDEATGRVGLADISETTMPEPLFLPKGSIRAFVTLLLSASCWTLIFRGQDVPGYLFSLLLTIIGYYFGFRYKVKAAGSRIFDVDAKEQHPLFLPAGFIRFFLIIGFGVAAIVLYRDGRLELLTYLEFFVILGGLILGHFFSRMAGMIKGSHTLIMLNHVKGGLVMGCSIALCVFLVSDDRMAYEYLCLALSAGVSFYFGSRSG